MNTKHSFLFNSHQQADNRRSYIDVQPSTSGENVYMKTNNTETKETIHIIGAMNMSICTTPTIGCRRRDEDYSYPAALRRVSCVEYSTISSNNNNNNNNTKEEDEEKEENNTEEIVRINKFVRRQQQQQQQQLQRQRLSSPLSPNINDRWDTHAHLSPSSPPTPQRQHSLTQIQLSVDDRSCLSLIEDTTFFLLDTIRFSDNNHKNLHPPSIPIRWKANT